MGQQHRVRTKRKRRVAYLERKRTAVKTVPAARKEVTKPKPKTKKAAAAAE